MSRDIHVSREQRSAFAIAEPPALQFVETKAKVLGRQSIKVLGHQSILAELVGEEVRNDICGETVNDNDASQGDNLEEDARRANSNLERLIEAVGALLSASGDLLGRLRHILGGAQAASDGTNASDDLGSPPRTDRCDC